MSALFARPAVLALRQAADALSAPRSVSLLPVETTLAAASPTAPTFTHGLVMPALVGRSLQVCREILAMRKGQVMPTALETGHLVAALLAHPHKAVSPSRVRPPTTVV